MRAHVSSERLLTNHSSSDYAFFHATKWLTLMCALNATLSTDNGLSRTKPLKASTKSLHCTSSCRNQSDHNRLNQRSFEKPKQKRQESLRLPTYLPHPRHGLRHHPPHPPVGPLNGLRSSLSPQVALPPSSALQKTRETSRNRSTSKRRSIRCWRRLHLRTLRVRTLSMPSNSSTARIRE